jgi:SAM-dependent MidA family methyltransferase
VSVPVRPSPELPPPPATINERWGESRAPLVERIRDEILAAGPLVFARFMELALYDPTDGYYARRADRPTREGDFLSAPELHPIFGAALARQVEECWERLGRPATFTLREEAAGSGALGLAILEALGAPARRAVRYLPTEATPVKEAAVRARLAAAGHAEHLASEAAPEEAMTGVVIANELLDALPVHRLTVRDGELLEIHVGWRDGWFADELLPPSTPELGATLDGTGVRLVDGQVAEVGLAAQAWLRGLAARLERGYALVIDYGHPAAQLYDAAKRAGGLLRTYRRHHAGDDPYRYVGEQDMTAHVDWTTLERVAGEAGLDVLGRTTQAEFLTGLGLGDLLVELQSRPGLAHAEYAAARAAVVRLLDPGALGRFGVLALGRGVAAEPPLRGLGFRLPARAG